MSRGDVQLRAAVEFYYRRLLHSWMKFGEENG